MLLCWIFIFTYVFLYIAISQLQEPLNGSVLINKYIYIYLFQLITNISWLIGHHLILYWIRAQWFIWFQFQVRRQHPDTMIGTWKFLLPRQKWEDRPQNFNVRGTAPLGESPRLQGPLERERYELLQINPSFWARLQPWKLFQWVASVTCDRRGFKAAATPDVE